MALEGKSDRWQPPEWYALFVAADILHCPPWEVLKHSIWYQQKAHIKNKAESEAQEILAQRTK